MHSYYTLHRVIFVQPGALSVDKVNLFMIIFTTPKIKTHHWLLGQEFPLEKKQWASPEWQHFSGQQRIWIAQPEKAQNVPNGNLLISNKRERETRDGDPRKEDRKSLYT